QLIARRVRELHIYCEIFLPTVTQAELAQFDPYGIILSGGPASVYDEGAPQLPDAVLELARPVLGICYGLQLLAHKLGGRVVRSPTREFGPAQVTVTRGD